MVALTAPTVLLGTLLLVAAFAGLWYYRFGEGPPVRATGVVAVGALFLAYSLATVAELLADPVEAAATLLLTLGLLALVQYAWVRVRA